MKHNFREWLTCSHRRPRLGKGAKRGLYAVFLMVFLTVSFSGAWATDLRCNGKLISEGDRQYEVLVKCGEPDFRESRVEKRIKRDFFRDPFPEQGVPDRYRRREPFLVEETVLIEVWIYNLGPTKFIRYLYFENGILTEITTGDYGY